MSGGVLHLAPCWLKAMRLSGCVRCRPQGQPCPARAAALSSDV